MGDIDKILNWYYLDFKNNNFRFLWVDSNSKVIYFKL